MADDRCPERHEDEVARRGDDGELQYPIGGIHAGFGDGHLLIQEPCPQRLANEQYE
jgi:hypothetical protein